MNPMQSEVVLEIDHLTTVFDLKVGSVASVRDVSLVLERGTILGVVGESGSGKSVTGLSVMGLIDSPGRIAGGSIRLNGRELTELSEPEMRQLRGREIAMIFQDPMTTLNPVLTIARQFYEVMRAHEPVDYSKAMDRAEQALNQVGIPAPRKRLSNYPHELSGGMRQRVCIAMALINDPAVVIADEPTTALDVTIQSQILHLIQKLAREKNTALIWVTHDLSVVAGLCDRVAVMYAGQIVESGKVDDILAHPRHPYTIGLMNSIPGDAEPGKPLQQIPGTQPSPLNLPGGCAFRLRCSRATDACLEVPPIEEAKPDHLVRCFNQDGALQ